VAVHQGRQVIATKDWSGCCEPGRRIDLLPPLVETKGPRRELRARGDETRLKQNRARPDHRARVHDSPGPPGELMLPRVDGTGPQGGTELSRIRPERGGPGNPKSGTRTHAWKVVGGLTAGVGRGRWRSTSGHRASSWAVSPPSRGAVLVKISTTRSQREHRSRQRDGDRVRTSSASTSGSDDAAATKPSASVKFHAGPRVRGARIRASHYLEGRCGTLKPIARIHRLAAVNAEMPSTGWPRVDA